MTNESILVEIIQDDMVILHAPTQYGKLLGTMK